ncbi:hypothetical protein Fmac_006170 [Flemingia macrophylla]|uniref:Uncharacterized protein n=1 Tax=Flemingia macrophylla TaxID=520843 RepID=A0ABD1NCM9_9FABA
MYQIILRDFPGCLETCIEYLKRLQHLNEKNSHGRTPKLDLSILVLSNDASRPSRHLWCKSNTKSAMFSKISLKTIFSYSATLTRVKVGKEEGSQDIMRGSTMLLKVLKTLVIIRGGGGCEDPITTLKVHCIITDVNSNELAWLRVKDLYLE